ncbi:DUF86 domain-containing protein [Paramagnetospirillum kuznetsovii]|uniref:DUF86 domain-containing protein n=1 Tax=Paramagnetospirillum kuznetsovii TaxID=2053833 RepID=A0A364P0I1_9PROT|nr:HepT-like ribonuclease domain-containing protein [Paramagnetospirillum kuznetsovii]RAU22859.1 DUF86 domain-containing protein [Paramagnetospirillum kuznetsovii]
MKDSRLYLLHIAECIERIERYAVTAPDLVGDTMALDAVLRNLQTMSEATQRLPDEVKARHPQIPWQRIAGFRNILVHGYLGGIDASIIRNVIACELPLLKVAIGTELSI